MVQEHRLSKARACWIAGLSQAALYRESTDRIERDSLVIAALNDTVERHGRWGFWKCLQRLRDQGHTWNHKRVHRVYCSMKLNLPRRTKKRIITLKRQPLVAPNGVNQMWALDFMHDTLYDGRKLRLLNVIDEGNREALRIECRSSIPSSRLMQVMEELIEFYGTPKAIRMDNGPEMMAAKLVSWAQQHGIELRYIQPGKPKQNAFVERFNRIVHQEVLNAWLFDSLAQPRQILEGWRIEYNTVRSHESLGKKTPLAYLPRVVNAEISTFKLST
jgi:putative transposase